MMRINKNIIWYFLIFLVIGCNQETDEASAELLTAFDFESGSQSWEGGISDFSTDFKMSTDYSFDASKVPNSIISESSGLNINADNPHGDLFYFFMRKVDGLQPKATYKLDFEFLIYTQLLTELNAFSSNEIYLKMGAVNYAPMLEQITRSNSTEYMILNVDKGNANSDSGEDLTNIGSLKQFTGDTPEIISGNSFDHDITVTANGNGEIWLVIGADSGLKGQLTFGMEALTVFYEMIN